MTTQNPTEEQEKKSLALEYRVEYPGCGEVTGRHKIEEIEENCAYNAYRADPLMQAIKCGYSAIGRAAGVAIPAVLSIYGANELIREASSIKNLEDFRDVSAVAIMLGLPLAYAAFRMIKKNLMGKHPVTYVGNYGTKPDFGLIDNLKLCANWLKVHRMQKEGKIRKAGIPNATDQELYYYDVWSGP